MEIKKSEGKNVETKSIVLKCNEENFRIEEDDYLIIIKQLPIVKIKYFLFGKNVFFYLFCGPKKIQYKLSEIPNPFFSLGPECKIYFLFNIFRLQLYLLFNF